MHARKGGPRLIYRIQLLDGAERYITMWCTFSRGVMNVLISASYSVGCNNEKVFRYEENKRLTNIVSITTERDIVAANASATSILSTVASAYG